MSISGTEPSSVIKNYVFYHAETELTRAPDALRCIKPYHQLYIRSRFAVRRIRTNDLSIMRCLQVACYTQVALQVTNAKHSMNSMSGFRRQLQECCYLICYLRKPDLEFIECFASVTQRVSWVWLVACRHLMIDILLVRIPLTRSCERMYI